MALTKTSKDHSEFDGQEPAFERKLEIFDKRSNTNKFWHIQVHGHFVIRHWGRHGTAGQWAVHRDVTDYHARDVAWDLSDKKRGKGYTEEASVLDRFTREI